MKGDRRIHIDGGMKRGQSEHGQFEFAFIMIAHGNNDPIPHHDESNRTFPPCPPF